MEINEFIIANKVPEHIFILQSFWNEFTFYNVIKIKIEIRPLI